MMCGEMLSIGREEGNIKGKKRGEIGITIATNCILGNNSDF